MQSGNKRVLLLIDQMGSGGAERQLSYLARCLKDNGFEVRLCRFYSGPIHYKDDLEKFGIEVETLSQGRSSLKRPFVIASIIKKWKPKAVIAYLDGTSMACCIAKTFTKFNLIVSERNTTQNLSLRERIKFFLYRFSDAIVCNSKSQYNFVSAKFPSLNDKLIAITNTIDTNRFKPSSKINGVEIPQIISTARIAPQKNILNYIKAVSILKNEGVNAKFNWFGAIHYDWYWNEVKQLHKQLELGDYLEFHIGGTKDVITEYQHSTHFVLPSIYEGFPNVLCEAMSCGLIASASNVSDSPLILNDDRFLFDPNSPEDIAKAIRNMLTLSDDEQRKLSIKNRQSIVHMCNMEKFAQKYIALINRNSE